MEQKKSISQEQLEKLQGLVNSINNGLINIGNVEKQKHELLHQVAFAEAQLKTMQKELEEEYGNINIDLKDGTYEEVVKEEIEVVEAEEV